MLIEQRLRKDAGIAKFIIGASDMVMPETVRVRKDAGIAKFITDAGKVIQRTDIPKRKGVRSKNIKHVLYGIQQGYCNGCKYHCQFKDLEVDHIVPRIKGGLDDDKNLQLLCGNCNRRKGASLQCPNCMHC